MNRTSWQVCSAPAISVKYVLEPEFQGGTMHDQDLRQRSGLEHVNRAAQGRQNSFGLEYIELVFTSAEPDCAGDTIAIHQRVGDEHALEVLATCVVRAFFAASATIAL